MASSLFTKLFQKHLKRFFLTQGREPMTPKEWMDIKNLATREINQTKGVPKKDVMPTQKGDVVNLFASEKEFADDLYSTTRNFIKNDPMFNLELAVKLRNPGVKTYGWTPSGDKSKLLSPKQRQKTLDELKKVMNNETYQTQHAEDLGYVDLTDDIFTIEKAEGGRIGMAGGGALKKFIEQLFIKASNDIRLGRGKFKGLSSEGKASLHDDLVVQMTEWQKTGKVNKLAIDYFGVDPHKAFGEVSQQVKKTGPEVSGIDDALKSDFEVMTKTDPLVSDDVLAKAYDEVFYQKPSSGDYKYDADVLADSIAEQLGKGSLDDFSQAQQFEIHNTALKRVTDDLKMKRTLKDVEEKMILSDFDPKNRKPNAEGGRQDFIFGGSTGLRALLKRLRGKNKRVFPAPPQGLRNIMGKGDIDYIDDLKLQQLETILKAAKIDKDMIAQIAKNKKMADPGLDFLMGKMDEIGLMPKNISKYTDVDKDIMDIEMMIKNYSDKKLKRKPHESGGLAYMLGEPTYMKYDGGGSVGHAPWLKPTGQPQPQGREESPSPQVGGAQSPGRGQPNPMKAPRGLPSVAPRTMDPQYMQQQAMQRMMMGQGQQRMGMEAGGSPRDRLQKDYESLTSGSDWMRTAPPKWWLFPEKYGKNRDDAMTFFKERFMYGDLEPIPNPWEAIKQSPELVKFKEWLEERKGKAEGGITQDDFNQFLKEREEGHREGGKHRFKEDWERYKRFKQYGPGSVQEAADGGRIGMMYGGDPGFQFEYGGSWADWRDAHQHQMPVTDYIKTRLPKERLPFRESFSLGGINKGRRAFMKWLAGILGTGVAAGSGILKLGKAAKVAKPAAKVTETIVQSNAVGMPPWFPSLVKRVIKEGEDVSESAGAMERQSVHRVTTPEGTPIEVMHDLTKGDIVVDIGEQTKHGWSSGRHGQPTRLILNKGEWIETPVIKEGKVVKGHGKGIKTKDEFSVEEAEFTGGHPENVKFDESVQFNYGDHGSDFSEIEKYAIGKNKDKKIIGKQADKDAWNEGRAEVEAEDIDFAKGGLAYLLGE